MAFSYSQTGEGGAIGGGAVVRSFPSINPHYSMLKIPSFNNHTVNYGNSIEQRIAFNSAVQYRFKMQWKILSQVNANIIMDFFIKTTY